MVKDIVASLEKLEKTAALYPPGSGVLRDFTDELHGRLARLLARVRVLELAVGADEIEYEGEVVYDGSKSDCSLAFALEEGGVRRLAFLEGIERGEIAAFVDALRDARAPGAEDLVTLLWQRGLRHVSYVTVDFFTDAATDAMLDRLDLEAAGHALVDRLRGRELAIEQVAAVRAPREGTRDEQDALDVYALTASETAEVQRRIADLGEGAEAARTARLLLALVAADAPDDVLRARLAALEETLAQLLDEGDIATAAEVVLGVRRLAGAAQVAAAHGPAKVHSNALRTFIAAATRKEAGARIAGHLGRSRPPGGASLPPRGRGDVDAKAIQDYIRACGRHAFPVLVELLGVSPRHESRFVAAFAESCRSDFAHLRDFAVDPNPRVALAAVRVLSEVAGDAARPEFYAATTHKDAAVRREAFLALARCKDPRALDRLIEAFDDPDPEIRASALKAFSASLVRARPELYGRMLMLVEARARFDARPPSEQEAIFAILGKVDPDRGVPFLAGVISKFAIFGRDRVHRARLAAIAALGDVATAHAESIVRRAAESYARHDDVREACRRALDRMELVRVNAETAPMDRSQVLRALESAKTRPAKGRA